MTDDLSLATRIPLPYVRRLLTSEKGLCSPSIKPSMMDPDDISTRMTSFDRLCGQSVLQHDQSHAVDDSGRMRCICFRRMKTTRLLFYPEYRGEMHDYQSPLFIVMLYETHAELKHEVIEFIFIDVRVRRCVFDPLQ